MLSLFHVGHNYWHPIIATSFSQGNSSEFSHIMPEEVGEHLIRDQRPFSSYRITPDPSDSQLHDGASSLQFTSLIFYRVQVRGQRQQCSGPLAEKQAHNIKDPAVYLTVDMGYFFIPVCTKLIWWGCCQKAIFSVSSDHRSQCHLKFQSCLSTEFAGVCFWMSEDNFSWNLPNTCVI